MTSRDDMLYCYLLDIVSHLQPLSHRCQLSFKSYLLPVCLSSGWNIKSYLPVSISVSCSSLKLQTPITGQQLSNCFHSLSILAAMCGPGLTSTRMSPFRIFMGGFNGRPLVQWPTRPLVCWVLEAPGPRGPDS